jgi:hypothetical protein
VKNAGCVRAENPFEIERALHITWKDNHLFVISSRKSKKHILYLGSGDKFLILGGAKAQHKNAPLYKNRFLDTNQPFLDKIISLRPRRGKNGDGIMNKFL